MWKVYLKSNEGIAVQSNAVRLLDCLAGATESILVGPVSYYTKGQSADPMEPERLLFRKRDSFKHEHEVRAAIPHFRELGITDGQPDVIERIRAAHRGTSPGKTIAVDLEKLVENVYVAPGTPDWLVSVVQSLLDRFDLNRKPIRSALDDPI
jgi:hypothetical protein